MPLERQSGLEGVVAATTQLSTVDGEGERALYVKLFRGAIMTEMLLRFFEFDRWANHESLRSLEAMTNPPERAIAVIAHIAATQRVWLERALSVRQSVAVWPKWSLSETAKELSPVLGEWTHLIATGELSREVAYTNTKGQQFRNSLSDVALHVAFHGVYHRGQIAALVRQHGGEPAYTDFIQAVRSGAVR
jgi:uncharacterized damage-inducible protein DinB